MDTLQKLIIEKRPKEIHAFLSNKPFIMYMNADGRTAVSFAVLHCLHCLAVILDFYGEKREELELVINPINLKNKDGSTPLHIATGMNDKQAVLLLLSKGALPNIPDNNGDTPLNIATTSGVSQDIVKALLYYNADPNIANNYDVSPIRQAAVLNKVKLLKMYLSSGGNLDSIDINGTTFEDDWYDDHGDLLTNEIKDTFQKHQVNSSKKKRSQRKKYHQHVRDQKLRKYIANLCTDLEKTNVNDLYNLAERLKVDSKDKSISELCSELATKIAIKRKLKV